MKHGMVIQFRLNPEDIMSCIDVLDMSKVSQHNMSLPMVCRLVLSSYLHGSRERGMIPKRDGFEYTDMVRRFTSAPMAKKLNVTNELYSKDAKNHADDVDTQYIDVNQKYGKVNQTAYVAQTLPMPLPSNDNAHMVRKRARVELAIDELEQRRAIDEDNFTTEQHARLIALHSALVQLNNDVDVDVMGLLE